MKMTFLSLIFCFFSLSCIDNPSEQNEQNSIIARYVLPFPVGNTYYCSLGFNMPSSHVGTFRYSVDFNMPVGTLVTAARSGRVVHILQSYLDNDQTPGHENVVIIMHEDTTYSRYVHLKYNGALVKIDQMVSPGDSIGLSGMTGTPVTPHLHFDVTKTFSGRDDQTIPFDFKNTIPHPLGLQAGVAYEALSY